MPINHQLKTIFIHIPKTAGTSIEFSLGMHGKNKNIGIKRYINQDLDTEHLFGGKLQHMDVRRFRKIVGREIFDRYFKFSIVRNPYDRLVSFIAWNSNSWENKQILTKETFRNYLMNSGKICSKRKYVLPKPQYKFLFCRGKLLVNEVLRFEKLEEGLKLLNKHLKEQIILEHRMQSSHMDYHEYYDCRCIEIVQRIYRKDFEYFEYNANEFET